ncbi:2-aminoethylphosphonate--pyruvate transaminase/phosphonoacetaldehyde hydrolase [Massilia umbonata]|uniref:Multifunctional fusion protein n=3 Tax=Pseudoduganella umbonata TaxID=864828 RepID=A0A4P8HUJ1_9BURK|nr:2-aminoethylphosphonate--pyruvate transaminase [Pseudoduganella umbonata]MBB3223448.1 2-aminoethylphosphonate--pyruvate transaminase/phosphonoacetaldehyde hydrolase [Pseudoduganella umbonata]QCP13659.1 2-aminoethylphosphonate--pyruvate transaminase [Pseudoduganella umbonata]
MQAPLLLTPGPLTTTARTKNAMQYDWGSWDGDFNALTARIGSRLVGIIDGGDDYVCVPLQGSGTFAVEAAIGTLVPRDGKLLVLANGAYGKRMAQLAAVMGRRVEVEDFGETSAVDPAVVRARLAADPHITHVGVIHCETSTGILNPLPAIAAEVGAAGRALVIDAMSAFGALPLSCRELAFDAVIGSSNKCLEGVPGMGFVLVRRAALEQAEGRAHSLSLDLHDQWRYMHRTGQWRYTPPTHVVAAFDCALDQYEEQGGQPARLARYSANCKALVEGLAAIGLRSFLPAEVQAPIIVTVYAPDHPNWNFGEFYRRVKEHGVILYPGKLTAVETFRVGCIGAIEPADIERAVAAVATVLGEMGISRPRRAAPCEGGVQAVVFDWAGTMVDFGSFAPTQVLIDAFEGFGVRISLAEARVPMGLAKWDHIQALGRQEGVAQRWQQRFGAPMTDSDVDTLYSAFLPLQVERVGQYSAPIAGAVDVLAALRAQGVKIGSCTGYPRVVVDRLLPRAAADGLVVDHVVATDDLPAGGRPGPWMALDNVVALGVTDVRACVKVDDTVPGIAEGLAAGMWTVGVALSGNEVGLAEQELAALPQDERERRFDAAAATLRAAGAHYVIGTIADLPEAIARIDARLARGERP